MYYIDSSIDVPSVKALSNAIIVNGMTIRNDVDITPINTYLLEPMRKKIIDVNNNNMM